MLDEIAHYRIFFKKDLRIATLRASQYMRSGKHKEAFKILSLFHIDMTQTIVSYGEREAALLLAELYEFGLGAAPNLAQALSLYNYCYERFTMEAGYKAGRVCEKMGDYGKAMEWYRKVLDWKVLSPTSWERNYREEEEAKSLLPYRLEISFRNLKKRMNPEVHDKISIAESYIAPKKCAVEVCPLGTLRELIIQPTRDTFSAKPLTSILNFLRSE